MGQFSKVIQQLIMHTHYHRGPWTVDQAQVGGLNQVYGPNHPTPFVYSICGKNINIFTRCTIRNQHDILKTAVANVSKGQTDMSHKGELQTLTKLSMRHQVYPNDTCHTTISESTIKEHSLHEYNIVSMTQLPRQTRSSCSSANYTQKRFCNITVVLVVVQQHNTLQLKYCLMRGNITVTFPII